MRFYQFEARRNPEMSSREKGTSVVKKYLDFYGTERVGVRMTNMPKLGLNPNQDFDTPLGIYFYPGDYFLETSHVPYMNDADYIQVFEYRKARVLDVSWRGLDTVKLLERLGKSYPMSRLLDLHQQSFSKALKPELPGGRLRSEEHTSELQSH